ncbi:hypothetical protein N7447_003106 [Penicillium robsamsonii]|uniref:uncharacterized protein n=1 Tax=Penicillium robsamsonii TaxID=1792511 RepID=UPI00254958BB|nr:uncharacterized protein N7447_003106 [Penicillium robsamsonii]KAJ5837080.1 hypothetical protein N7447_003106 [Penicillium robsamsonii]
MDWPTITIGNDKLPTPEPESSASQPSSTTTSATTECTTKTVTNNWVSCTPVATSTRSGTRLYSNSCTTSTSVATGCNVTPSISSTLATTTPAACTIAVKASPFATLMDPIPDFPDTTSTPAPDTTSSTPAPNRTSSTPAPDKTSSTPAPDTTSSAPAPDKTSSTPALNRTSSTPAPDTTSSTPGSTSGTSSHSAPETITTLTAPAVTPVSFITTNPNGEILSYPSQIVADLATQGAGNPTTLQTASPSQTSGNNKGSIQCRSVDDACDRAYMQYVDDTVYTSYTSYTADIKSGMVIVAALGQAGCAAMYTCDNDDYGFGMTGRQIKAAVEYLKVNDKVNKCGTAYMSNSCHVTLNYCTSCKGTQ